MFSLHCRGWKIYHCLPAPRGLDQVSLLNTPRKAATLVHVETGRIFVLNAHNTKIGRSNESDIVLAGDLTASRQQAHVMLLGEHYYVEDLQSTNGTLLNGELIECPVRLMADDVVTVGRSSFVFCPTQRSRRQKTTEVDSTFVPAASKAAVPPPTNLLGRMVQAFFPARAKLSLQSSGPVTVPNNQRKFARGQVASSVLRNYQKRQMLRLQSSTAPAWNRI